MAQFPSLPLFTDAYLADTRHLNAAQHGAYLLLLMMAWRTTDCTLPNDDETLARWASMDLRTWLRNRDTIMAFWTLRPDGKWYQKRLADERKYVEEMRSKKSDAGKSSALKRKGRHPTGVPTGQTDGKSKHQSLSTPSNAFERCQKSGDVNSKKSDTQPAKVLEDNNTASTGVPTELQQNGNTHTHTHILDTTVSNPPVAPQSEKETTDGPAKPKSKKSGTRQLGSFLAEIGADDKTIPPIILNRASCNGISTQLLELEWRKFCNYFLGKGTPWKDWGRAWDNWLTRAAISPSQRGPAPAKPDRIASIAGAAMATAMQRQGVDGGQWPREDTGAGGADQGGNAPNLLPLAAGS